MRYDCINAYNEFPMIKLRTIAISLIDLTKD